jgi:transposase
MASTENITISRKEYEELKRQNQLLRDELAELKRLIHGSSSERFVSNQDPLQGSLFEEEYQPKEEPEQKQEVKGHARKRKQKKQPLRTEIPAHLPRREEIEEPKNLPQGAKRIGETVTEILEYKPPSIYVRRIVRPKYIIESTDEKTDILVAPLPSLPIPKSNAGSSVLAYLIVSKYVDHLPFYRIRKILKRQNFDVSESTLNGWFVSACNILEPLYDTLRKVLLQTNYLQADETPMPVLTKDKAGSTHKGYQWVYHDPLRRLVLFDYRKSRGREGPNDILANFQGHLQTDGYAGYNNLKNKEKITLMACMAHARRYFDKALNNDKARAQWMLTQIQRLYAIERFAKNHKLTADEIYELRQMNAKPILEEMKTWLDEQIILVAPESSIGKAIAYSLNLWSRLIRYIDEGKYCIDNNRIENAIRPIALGRKNYLFAGSHDAAQRAAMMYSFMACCKLHDQEPFQWLTQIFTIISDQDPHKLYELIPGYKPEE